jgi:hypothetical protein
VTGRLPAEYGWYEFAVDGSRNARVGREADQDPEFERGHQIVRGYLVGDRLIPDNVRVDPNPEKLFDQTVHVALVPLGLETFSRAVAIRDRDGNLIYTRMEFPQGAEAEVESAYLDRLTSVDAISGVTPALDLAFRWLSHQRVQAERREREATARRAEEDRQRLRAEQMEEALRSIGTAAGRRALAEHDFPAAARAALAIGGAEFLASRPNVNRGEMIVQYRYRHRRLECVVETRTLRVVEAGVCLAGNDRLFTLESLPTVIREGMDTHRLHVFRHGDGDMDMDDD